MPRFQTSRRLLWSCLILLGLDLSGEAWGQAPNYHGSKFRSIGEPSEKSISVSRSDSKRGTTATQRIRPQGRTDFTWNGDGGETITQVVISILEQKIYAYQNERLVGAGPISTGREGYSTPRGSFSVMSKNEKHRSNLYGMIVSSSGRVINGDASSRSYRPSGASFVGSPMPYFMRLTSGGVGLHAGFVTGAPASHGCIRLPYGLAQKMFFATSVGTPVSIE